MTGQAMAKIAALIVALGLAAAPAVRAYTPPQLNKPAAFCQYEVFLNNGKDVQINELNVYNLPRRLFGYRRCQIADHYTEFVVDWFYGHHHHFPRGVLGVPPHSPWRVHVAYFYGDDLVFIQHRKWFVAFTFHP